MIRLSKPEDECILHVLFPVEQSLLLLAVGLVGRRHLQIGASEKSFVGTQSTNLHQTPLSHHRPTTYLSTYVKARQPTLTFGPFSESGVHTASMADSVTVGVIGATGNTGRTVVAGMLSSEVNFVGCDQFSNLIPTLTNSRLQIVTSFTRESSIGSLINKELSEKGVHVVGYDLSGPRQALVQKLQRIDVLISCITWEHIDQQLIWIEAAKEAGVKRFVPSEWVGPAPRGVIDIKDKVWFMVCAELQQRIAYKTQ